MGPDQEWGQFFSWSGPVRILDRHYIAIGLAPGAYKLAAGDPARLGKLRCEIVRRPPKRARTRFWMTLADECLKMSGDSQMLGRHKKN